MELQWPLILFTSLTAWACGVFGGTGVLALLPGEGGKRGAARKSQMPLCVASVVLLAVGGICVFFHLQHWERIFNGFGHITSGITQELIAIVVFVVIALMYFLKLRKSGEGAVPKALAWCAIAISVVLAAVCAHSYMMAAKPAWNNVLEVASIVGAACLMGPATCAVVMAVRGDEVEPAGLPAVAGSAIGAVCTLAYAVYLQVCGGSGSGFIDVGNYFDPTHPVKAMVDVAATASSQAPLIWAGAVVVGALVPLACCVWARKRGDAAAWKIFGAVAVVAALAGSIFLRMAFYSLGLSVFALY